MKNSILALSFISFISCNSYNDKMNALLNKKSELESVIKITDSTDKSYGKKITDVINGRTDENNPEINFADTSIADLEKRLESKEYKMYSDSTKKYYSLRRGYEESLKQVNYSIDSLSKLK